jgi:hypothetical protein
MAFIAAKRPVAATKIDLTANDQHGNPIDIEFVAQYRRHMPDDLADLKDGMANSVRVQQGLELVERPDGSPVPPYAYTSDMAFIKDKLVGWLGVKDGGGDAIPYSEQALENVLSDWPELIGPLFKGFFSAHEGARQKN